MIFSRIIEHVRKQQWTGAVIELAIVILGVFIGLQVTNWNTTRKQRESETDLVRELRSNLASEIKIETAWIKLGEKRTHELEDGIAVVQGSNSSQTLTADECTALWRSGIYLYRTSENPTLIALLSPTRLNLIHNLKLQTALLSYYSLHERFESFSKLIIDRRSIVVNEFPDAFSRRLNRHLRFPSTDIECNLEAMRASRALKNKLLSNLGATNGVLATAKRDLSRLKQLKTEVDAYHP